MNLMNENEKDRLAKYKKFGTKSDNEKADFENLKVMAGEATEEYNTPEPEETEEVVEVKTPTKKK